MIRQSLKDFVTEQSLEKLITKWPDFCQEKNLMRPFVPGYPLRTAFNCLQASGFLKTSLFSQEASSTTKKSMKFWNR